jgi:hypothetical protein
MMCAEQKTALIDEFRHNVRRHFPVGVWRSLFRERTGRAQFGTAVRTLLCIECPEDGPLTRQGLLAGVSRLARIHGAHVDPCTETYVHLSSSNPVDGLRLGLALQRLFARARLRMSLMTGPCNLVRGYADGQNILMLLGKQRERAETLTGSAAAGTVRISPETYDLLGGAVSDELGSCVVMAEFDGDKLKEVTLTLPPDASADVSTFAGLGLT